MKERGFTMKCPENIDFKKMLKGEYEAAFMPADLSPLSPVPDFGYNILNRKGLLYSPAADEFFLESGGKKPVWPGNKPFAVCLTHDVDAVSCYSVRQSLRSVRNCFFSGAPYSRSFASAVRKLAGVNCFTPRARGKDPFHSFEKWLEIENRFSARSTFFFWPGMGAVNKKHKTDCLYDLNDGIYFESEKRSVAEVIREIGRRGWEIGLHPSWYSYDAADSMKKQKESLEKITGGEIVSVRQHYLHYDIRVTPRVHADAGLKYDSSLGFNNNVGFRFGTSYPWKLYDLEKNGELPVLEVPLIIQDGALLSRNKGLALDIENAFDYIVMIAERVIRTGGVLTLLWHPHYIAEPGWAGLYEKALEYLDGRSAYFASVREIGEWWTRHNSDVRV
ncbi:MAG: polysaccharide deacetylase family protein [Candidatus Omnitrophota bacterium]